MSIALKISQGFAAITNSRLLAIALVLGGGVLSASALGILVPAYFYPRKGGEWELLNQAATRVPLTAICNPKSGPSEAKDENYARALRSLRQAGGRVVAYIHTSYTARPRADVQRDIDRYLAHYEIDGFFIDEMTSDPIPGHVRYYQDIYDYVKRKARHYTVIGNPGRNASATYLDRPAADTLVTFENGNGYARHVVDRWTKTQPSQKLANLCYNVLDASLMTNFIQLAVQRNIGFIYITDDRGANPWDRLPSYWEAEIRLVAEVNRRAGH